MFTFHVTFCLNAKHRHLVSIVLLLYLIPISFLCLISICKKPMNLTVWYGYVIFGSSWSEIIEFCRSNRFVHYWLWFDNLTLQLIFIAIASDRQSRKVLRSLHFNIINMTFGGKQQKQQNNHRSYHHNESSCPKYCWLHRFSVFGIFCGFFPVNLWPLYRNYTWFNLHILRFTSDIPIDSV